MAAVVGTMLDRRCVQFFRALGLALLAAQGSQAAPVCTGAFSLDADLATGSAGLLRSLAHVDHGATQLLVAGSDDTIMRVWDLSPAASTTPREYKGHQGRIWALKWIAELGVLASACGDGTIHLWPVSVLASQQSCADISACCDGTGLGCQGEHLLSWKSFSMTQSSQIHSIEWVSNGDGTGTLVGGWGDGGVRTWLYDGTAWSFGLDIQPDVYEGKDRTYDMVWMLGQSSLATASPDWPHPRIWSDLTAAGHYEFLRKVGEQPGDGVCPGTTFEHCNAVLAVATDAAGDKLATGSMDRTIILWDGATKTKYAQLTSHNDHVASLVWLHSEDLIASGSGDGEIHIWDGTVTADSDTPEDTLVGHSGSINALVWIPSEAKLAAADSGGNVKLWTCS